MKMCSRLTWMNAAVSQRQCDTSTPGAYTDDPDSMRVIPPKAAMCREDTTMTANTARFTKIKASVAGASHTRRNQLMTSWNFSLDEAGYPVRRRKITERAS